MGLQDDLSEWGFVRRSAFAKNGVREAAKSRTGVKSKRALNQLESSPGLPGWP